MESMESIESVDSMKSIKSMDSNPLMASYPMYNLPEATQWVDAWWQAVAQRLQSLRQVPQQLTTPEDYYVHWQADNLLLSQTCGYPLTHELAGKVQYVITPCYATPYVTQQYAGANYCSLVLVAESFLPQAQSFAQLRGTSLAFNSEDSQSGFNCLRPMLRDQGVSSHAEFFAELHVSGGHRQSLAMVKQGQADACAIDCVTFALLSKYAPNEVQGLRVIDTSPTVPGLPFITTLHRSSEQVQQLRDALLWVQQQPHMQQTMQQLLITDWQVLELSDYDVIKQMSED